MTENLSTVTTNNNNDAFHYNTKILITITPILPFPNLMKRNE